MAEPGGPAGVSGRDAAAAPGVVPSHLKKKRSHAAMEGQGGMEDEAKKEKKRLLQEELQRVEAVRKKVEGGSGEGRKAEGVAVAAPKSGSREPSPISSSGLKLKFNRKLIAEALSGENKRTKFTESSSPSNEVTPVSGQFAQATAANSEEQQHGKGSQLHNFVQTPTLSIRPPSALSPFLGTSRSPLLLSPLASLNTPSLSGFRLPSAPGAEPSTVPTVAASSISVPSGGAPAFPSEAGPKKDLEAAEGGGEAKVKKARAPPAKGVEVEKPDWLPEGWRVEVKVRTGGKTSGTTDKYYFHPASNKRFRSRVEVQKFLETGEVGAPRSKTTVPKKESSPAPVRSANADAFDKHLAEIRSVLEQKQKSTPPSSAPPSSSKPAPPLKQAEPAANPPITAYFSPLRGPSSAPASASGSFPGPSAAPGLPGPGLPGSSSAAYPVPLVPRPTSAGFPLGPFGPLPGGGMFAQSMLPPMLPPGGGFPFLPMPGMPGARPPHGGPLLQPYLPNSFPASYMGASLHQQALHGAAFRAHGVPSFAKGINGKGKASKAEKFKLVPTSKKDLEVLGRKLCGKAIIKLARDHLKRPSALPLKDILARLPKDLFLESAVLKKAKPEPVVPSEQKTDHQKSDPEVLPSRQL